VRVQLHASGKEVSAGGGYGSEIRCAPSETRDRKECGVPAGEPGGDWADQAGRLHPNRYGRGWEADFREGSRRCTGSGAFGEIRAGIRFATRCQGYGTKRWTARSVGWAIAR